MDLVKGGFEALQRGELGLFEEWTTPDLVIVQPPEVPDAKSYEGRAAVAEAWQDWPNQWEDYSLDLIEVIDVSNDVLVSVTRHRGRGRTSGIEMDFHVFYVITSAMESWREWRCSSAASRPSKPWGCRSRTLRPDSSGQRPSPFGVPAGYLGRWRGDSPPRMSSEKEEPYARSSGQGER